MLLCCVGTYFTHVQTCDNVRVPSATQWTASVHTLHMSKTCSDTVHVQRTTQLTASVHTLHMSKPVLTALVHTLHMSKSVIMFVFKVLRNGLFWYLCERSSSKCCAVDRFGTYFMHVETCDNVRVQSATQWKASVYTLQMSKPVITFVFKVLRNGLLPYIHYTCPKPAVILFMFKELRNGLLRYILYTCPNLW